MLLTKRDCPLKIELIPKGAGWTHVNLTVGDERLFFVISNVFGDQFSDFARALCLFTPEEDEYGYDKIIEYEDGTFEVDGEIREYSFIPFRAKFTWDEEPSYSRWVIEREPNLDSDFTVKLHIEIHREEDYKEYNFEFLYKDICYAVAKAYTTALKEYGFFGYHFSTYTEYINVNHLLFLKAVALNCLELVKKRWDSHPSGHGEVTNFNDELELLLFDM